MKTVSGFQADVQGMRGIAVLLVVLYHAGVPLFPGGYVGVDIFFVLSGYLITGLLVREKEETGTIDFPRFYARRGRRLLPAAFVVFVFTLWAGSFIYAPLEQQQVTASALAAALYAANYWFASQATDYLAGNAENDPFLHTWSLAVEEQYYLVWPALIFLVLLRADRSSYRWRLAGTVLLVTVASYLACRHLTWKSQPWAFFGVHTRAWEFAVGAAALLASERMPAMPAAIVRLAAWLGLACIGVAVATFDRGTMFPGSAAWVPVAGTFLIVVACRSGKSSLPAALLASRPLVALGNVSYSWYLWHWPMLVFAGVLYGHGRVVPTTAAVGASLACAWLSYRWVENPIRMSPYLARRTRVTLLGALILTGAGAAAALTARWDAGVEMQTEAQRRFSAARLDRPGVYATDCHAKYDAVTAPECAFGRPDSLREVVIFGDSHAAHWFPAFEQLALEHGWRLSSFTKSACPPVVVTVFNKVKKRNYTECDEWREGIIGRLLAAKPALVVVSSSSSYVNPTTGQRDGVATLDAWQAGLEALVSRLASAGIAVLVVHDIPNPGFNVPLCLARAQMGLTKVVGACAFAVDEHNASIQHLARIERETAARWPNGMFMDLTAQICPGNRCEVDRDGVIVYSDGEHLTASYSRTLAEPIAGVLRDHAARAPATIGHLLRE